MEHVYFFDGNQKRISWAIRTDQSLVEQSRDHPETYLDKVTNAQAKYIALHAGIFWCIGRFIIKNGDVVQVMLDSRSMYESLVENKGSTDSLIYSKVNFLNQLIDQRKLNVKYQIIEHGKNIAARLL